MADHKEVEFLENTIEAIVSNPKDINIDRKVDEQGVLLTLTVNEDDIGKVIGKEGRIANALRLLLRAVGYENDVRAHLKIDVPRDNEE